MSKSKGTDVPKNDTEVVANVSGMAREEIRDVEYRALVQGQRALINQVTEISRAQRSMQKLYDKQLEDFHKELKANTEATNSVKSDTADLVGAIKAIQGGMTVLGWIGKCAKPLFYIGVPGAIILAAWHGLEDWLKNFPRHP